MGFALACSTFHFISPHLSVKFITHWINVTPVYLISVSFAVSHETDVVWVQESCRFTAASSHSVMLWTCAEERCESGVTVFYSTLALREEGRVMLQQKCMACTNSQDLMKGMLWCKKCEGYQLLHHVPDLPQFVPGTNLISVFTSAVGWQIHCQKRVQICLELLNVTVAQWIGTNKGCYPGNTVPFYTVNQRHKGP